MTYTVVVTEAGDLVTLCESGDKSLMILMAEVIAKYAAEDVSSVELWRTDEAGMYAGDEFAWRRYVAAKRYRGAGKRWKPARPFRASPPSSPEPRLPVTVTLELASEGKVR